MTMAPSRKKRAYWLEILFISILLFLLMGSRSQGTKLGAGARSDFQLPLHQSLATPALTLK